MTDNSSPGSRFTGRNEYRFIPFLNLSYAVCLIALMFFIPAEDTLKMQILLLLVIVYVGVLSGCAVRALERVERRLDELG